MLIDFAICLLTLLYAYRQQGADLTPRSLKFLTIDPRDLESFAQVHKYGALKKQVITVICAIP